MKNKPEQIVLIKGVSQMKKILSMMFALILFGYSTQATEINVYKNFTSGDQPLGAEIVINNFLASYGTGEESSIEISEWKIGYRKAFNAEADSGSFWGVGYISKTVKTPSFDLGIMTFPSMSASAGGFYAETGYRYQLTSKIHAMGRLQYNTVSLSNLETINYGVSVGYSF